MVVGEVGEPKKKKEVKVHRLLRLSCSGQGSLDVVSISLCIILKISDSDSFVISFPCDLLSTCQSQYVKIHIGIHFEMGRYG